jgi:hypothetical protein
MMETSIFIYEDDSGATIGVLEKEKDQKYIGEAILHHECDLMDFADDLEVGAVVLADGDCSEWPLTECADEGDEFVWPQSQHPMNLELVADGDEPKFLNGWCHPDWGGFIVCHLVEA